MATGSGNLNGNMAGKLTRPKAIFADKVKEDAHSLGGNTESQITTVNRKEGD